MRHALTQQ